MKNLKFLVEHGLYPFSKIYVFLVIVFSIVIKEHIPFFGLGLISFINFIVGVFICQKYNEEGNSNLRLMIVSTIFDFIISIPFFYETSGGFNS